MSHFLSQSIAGEAKNDPQLLYDCHRVISYCINQTECYLPYIPFYMGSFSYFRINQIQPLSVLYKLGYFTRNSLKTN